MADVLAGHFADAHAQPAELAWAFHGLYVSIHPNSHIDAVAESADRERVMETGRWLVRNGTDQCAVTVGLAILGAVGIEAGDIPLVQTIGLLSECFGSLAARALERVDGGAQALIWLADRVAGWGRLYVVEALCRLREPTTYRWLRPGRPWQGTTSGCCGSPRTSRPNSACPGVRSAPGRVSRTSS